jgi:hypothetical protein
LQAAETLAAEAYALRAQRELELTQARYESERARQQYSAVDPLNRLVAGELERRWNEALRKVADLEEGLQHLAIEDAVTDEERRTLVALGRDLAAVWGNPATLPETKKRIARTLVKEIVLFEEGAGIKAIVHWQGGEHTEARVARLTYRASASPTNAHTVDIIRSLARQMPDRFIARVLNRLKIPTAKGHAWNEARVRAIRHGYEVDVYREGERQGRGELNMLEAAKELGVERRVIGELINRGCLHASQVCACAPWVIRREDLYQAKVQDQLRKGKRAPCAENQKRLPL